jgi:phospholipid/cholesterol/gamma-HCH transport system permease protein
MATVEASPSAGKPTPWVRPLGRLGRLALEAMGSLGRQCLFLGSALGQVVRPPFRPFMLLEQVHFIGNRSLSIIVLTSAFTGLVLALQGYNALSRFGADEMVGALVALSLTRELAPVLAALMVTARAGSAIAATIGTMRVTEQIDALEAMAIDPIDYLVTPRLLAGLIAVPMLTAIFTLVGLGVAQLFTGHVLGLDASKFASSAFEAVEWEDASAGLYKSVVFAVFIVWVAAYRGYFASGGALGVGRATTRAVVETSVLILAADYVMTALMF